MGKDEEEELDNIVHPHVHDVLSGRGNFVNHHAGNENFRKLVKAHKPAYVACPKARKGTYSKIIYHEIRTMNPPGRFLKQDPNTKLWSSIGVKEAIYKTRQALREGAPDLLKKMQTVGGEESPEEMNSGVDRRGEEGVQQVVAQNQNNAHPPLTSSLLGNNMRSASSLSDAYPSLAIQQQLGASYNPFAPMGGLNPILAMAAARIQAQQRIQQLQQNPSILAELEAQLQARSSRINPSNPFLAVAAQIQLRQQLQQQLQQLPVNPGVLAEVGARLEALKDQTQSNPQREDAATSKKRKQTSSQEEQTESKAKKTDENGDGPVEC